MEKNGTKISPEKAQTFFLHNLDPGMLPSSWE